MNDKMTRNLSLSLLLGLFALYGHTVHDLRVDSVSTTGIKVKYRGIASIDCPPVDSADDLKKDDSSVCQHYIKVEDIKVGKKDHIKITAVALHKGQVTKGSTTLASDHPDAKNITTLKKDFIVGLLKESSKKADEVKKNTITIVEEKTEEPVVETPAEEKVVKNGPPKITIPSNLKDESKDDDIASLDLDEDSLEDALEKYETLKAEYSSCNLSKPENKKISKLITEYDSRVETYRKKEEKLSDSTDTALEKISSKTKEKLTELVSKLEDIDETDLEKVDNQTADAQLKCLISRAKDIGDKNEQFGFYAENIHPILRDAYSANSVAELESAAAAIDGAGFKSLQTANNEINAVSSIQFQSAVSRVATLTKDPNAETIRNNVRNNTQALKSALSPDALALAQESEAHFGLNNTNRSIYTGLDGQSSTAQTSTTNGVIVNQELTSQEILKKLAEANARLNREARRAGKGNSRLRARNTQTGVRALHAPVVPEGPVRSLQSVQ